MFLFILLLGKRLFHYLKSRNIEGQTGRVAFDDNGDRIYAGYDVINIREGQKRRKVGSFFYDAVSVYYICLNYQRLNKHKENDDRILILN